MRSTWYVDDDAAPGGDGSQEHPFQYIQDAVDAANDNDQIYVCHGIYNESIDITKRLELSGGYEDLYGNDTDGSIINGGSIAIFVHTMSVDSGKINGFTIQNSGFGIFIDYSSHIEIYNNTIKNNYRGMFIFHSNNDVITENIISNNTWSGINIEATDHSTITDNYINQNKYGLLISDNCLMITISLNCFENNTIYGIIIMRCSGNTIAYNDFINNTKHAGFSNCWNQWNDNYWNTRILPIYFIWGELQSLRYPPIRMPIPQVDWRPTKERNTDW